MRTKSHIQNIGRRAKSTRYVIDDNLIVGENSKMKNNKKSVIGFN